MGGIGYVLLHLSMARKLPVLPKSVTVRSTANDGSDLHLTRDVVVTSPLWVNDPEPFWYACAWQEQAATNTESTLGGPLISWINPNLVVLAFVAI